MIWKKNKSTVIFEKGNSEEVLLENIGEELRVLYVALTRAKEKLIMVGSLSKVEQKMQGYEALQNREEKQLSFSMLSGANTYFDWVLPCFLRYPNSKMAEQVQIIGPEELVSEELFEELGDEYTKERLQDWDTDRVFSEDYKKQIEAQFDYEYPYQNQEHVKMKFTVSELKKRQSLAEESGELLCKEEEIVPLLPKKLSEEEVLTGASRGSAYHKVLELLDFTKDYDAKLLKESLVKFKDAGKLSKEMYESIWLPDILKF